MSGAKHSHFFHGPFSTVIDQQARNLPKVPLGVLAAHQAGYKSLLMFLFPTLFQQSAVPVSGVFALRVPGALLVYYVSRHINGNNMRRILRIPQLSTPYATNGTDGHGVREMCHKEREMVAKIQPISPANFLFNMVKIFANIGGLFARRAPGALLFYFSAPDLPSHREAPN